MPIVNNSTNQAGSKTIQYSDYEPKFDWFALKNSKLIASSLEIMGYKGLTDDEEAYLITTNGYFGEMVQFYGQGVRGLSDYMSNRVVDDAAAWLRTFADGDNTTFMTFSFPVDTANQRQYADKIIANVERDLNQKNVSVRKRQQLEQRQRLLLEKYSVLQGLERSVYSREYIGIIYDPNRLNLHEKMVRLRNSSMSGTRPFAFSTLNRDQKLKILHSVNNMSGTAVDVTTPN